MQRHHSTRNATLYFILFTLIDLTNTKVCNPLEYGAKGDGITNDTVAIQKAIDSCSDPESVNNIVFPSNYSFLSFPIKIKASNTQLHISSNSTLIASPDYENWPVHGSQYVDFITNEPNINNLEISGHGEIFGNGQIWWTLRQKGLLKYQRPRLISLGYFTDINIYDISLRDSPFWNLNIFNCSNVKIHNINITLSTVNGTEDVEDVENVGAPNVDGIDIGCDNVHIYDCVIENGDDTYCLKVGAFDVLIENSTARYGNGLVAGTGGNISNATFRNMIADQTKWGIKLKATQGNFGNDSDIIFKNITFKDVQKAINMFEYINHSGNHECVDMHEGLQWVPMSNITFEDISGTYTEFAGELYCCADYPCIGLKFTNIDLTSHNTTAEKWECSDYVYGTATNVTPPLNCLQQL